MAAFTEVFPWLSNVDPPQARPYTNWKSTVLYIPFLPAGPLRHLCTGSALMNNPMLWLHPMKDISGQSAKDQTACQVAKDQTPWSTGQGPNTFVNCPRTKHLGKLPKDQTPWLTGQGPNTFGQPAKDQTPWSIAQGPNTPDLPWWLGRRWWWLAWWLGRSGNTAWQPLQSTIVHQAFYCHNQAWGCNSWELIKHDIPGSRGHKGGVLLWGVVWGRGAGVGEWGVMGTLGEGGKGPLGEKTNVEVLI